MNISVLSQIQDLEKQIELFKYENKQEDEEEKTGIDGILQNQMKILRNFER